MHSLSAVNFRKAFFYLPEADNVRPNISSKNNRNKFITKSLEKEVSTTTNKFSKHILYKERKFVYIFIVGSPFST